MAQTTKIWRLKRGADRRVRAGHPWVYSNELQASPKGIEPGEKIVLLDAGGKFLAHGYGNPASLIAFRVVSRVEAEADWDSVASLTKRLSTAWNLRAALGANSAKAKASFRWMFGEGDDFPGLVIDVYRTGTGAAAEAKTVVVVQAHTAGVDRIIPNLLQAIEAIAKPEGVVLRNDVTHRRQEGLPIEEPKVLGTVSAEGEWIRVRSADARAAEDATVLFSVDLVRGQKTGFFLDQSENIGQFLDLLNRAALAGKKTIKVLDLCCYVGQWSTQIAAAASARGLKVEALLVDASARALSFAKANVERAGGRAEVLEADVLQDLPKLVDLEFDVVVCDPPALIKGRKDIPTGKPAYLKLNTEAFRLLAKGGWMVTCSCSQLLEEAEFAHQVSKAALRNAKEMRWLARGTQAIDHPLKLEFPEGKYLKMWIGKESRG